MNPFFKSHADRHASCSRVSGVGADSGRARLNDRFAASAEHWGFAVRLCRPYRAETFDLYVRLTWQL